MSEADLNSPASRRGVDEVHKTRIPMIFTSPPHCFRDWQVEKRPGVQGQRFEAYQAVLTCQQPTRIEMHDNDIHELALQVRHGMAGHIDILSYHPRQFR